MPILDWPTKREIPGSGGSLVTESIIFPGPQDPVPGSAENRLILGDNLRVMDGLMGEYEGQVDLIYADPPFFTNKGYPARVGRGEDSRKPEEWQLAEGYQDQWKDLDSYLDMLYSRLKLMHRLLAVSGSLYLHLDWHANAYARVLLDEIFGYENLRNEIIWTYHGPSPIQTAFNRKHDTILFYSKTDQYVFNVDDVRIPYASNTVDTFKSSKKAGFGKVPDLDRGKVPEDWWYFPVVARLHQERTGYPTQKPERLLERIIQASTNPGDLVADFFSGAGTAGVAAENLGRRFILSDLEERAINTSRSRLVLNRQERENDPAKEGKKALPIFLQREMDRVQRLISSPDEKGYSRITKQGGALHLPRDLAAETVYWEVDPDWEGDVFHSRRQAARPWRKGDVPISLSLPDNVGKICVRVVLASGELFQQIFN